jgi:hypothetical protein
MAIFKPSDLRINMKLFGSHPLLDLHLPLLYSPFAGLNTVGVDLESILFADIVRQGSLAQPECVEPSIPGRISGCLDSNYGEDAN